MGTNNIQFQITDGVAPTIQPKIEGIGTAARVAQTGLNGLQTAINQIGTGGLTNLQTQLNSISKSSQTLATTTTRMGQAAFSAASGIDKLGTSFGSLNTKIIQVTASMQAFAAVASQASTNANTFTTAQNNAASATNKVTTATGAAGISSFQASSALKVLEGSTMGASLAAAALIRQSTLMSGILAAAFPVIGAIALIEILGTIVGVVGNVIGRFTDMGTAIDFLPPKMGEVEKAIQGIYEKTHQAALEMAKLQIQTPRSGSETNAQKAVDNMRIANQVGALNVDEAIRKNQNEQITLKTLQDELAVAQKQLDVAKAAKEIAASGKQGYFPNDDTSVFGTGTPDLFGTQMPKVVPGVGNQVNISSALQRGAEVFTDNSAVDTAIAKVADLRGAVREATAQVALSAQDILTTIAETTKNVMTATVKNGAQEAIAQMKQFNIQLADLERSALPGHPITPQQKLDLTNTQLQTALPQNIPTLSARAGQLTQEVNKGQANQENTIDTLIQKYQDITDQIGLYSDALKEQQLMDKATLQLQKDKITASPSELAALRDAINASVEGAHYQQALNEIYKEANGPLIAYKAGIQAATQLLADGAITQIQYTQAVNLSKKAYADATVPLNEYYRGLQQQIDLFGQYGLALEVTTQLQQAQNIKRERGLTLSEQEATQLSGLLTLINIEKAVNADVNTLYEQNAGAIQKVIEQQLALNKAKQLGIITEQQFRQGVIATNTALAQQKLELGQGGIKDQLTVVLGNYAKDFTNLATGITKVYTQAFDTLANGAGDAFAKVLTGTETLSQAMRDLAQEVLSSLLSGFIKLGIQWAINAVLGNSIQAAATAAGVGQAAVLAAAWAPVAAAVDTATFGAAGVAADASLTATYGLSATLAAATKFAGGGLVSGPGTGLSDSIPAFLGRGEFVTNAESTAANLGTLQAINNGKSVGNGTHIQVIHDGSTAIAIQPLDEGRVRIIARQEADRSVHTNSASVVSSLFANPNSRASKTLKRNYVIGPRR